MTTLVLENILIDESHGYEDHGACHDYEWTLDELNIKKWDLETYFGYFDYFNNTINNMHNDIINLTDENEQSKNKIIGIDIKIAEHKNKLEQLKIFVNNNGKITKNPIINNFNDNEKNIIKNTKNG